jgi:hypothetical protein
MKTPRGRLIAAALMTVPLALSLAACGGGEVKGGATTCSEFQKANENRQTEIIAKLQEEKAADGDQSLSVGDASLYVAVYVSLCQFADGSATVGSL